MLQRISIHLGGPQQQKNCISTVGPFNQLPNPMVSHIMLDSKRLAMVIKTSRFFIAAPLGETTSPLLLLAEADHFLEM